MIPKFSNWVETEENPALSVAQHEVEEKNLNLEDLVKRRLEKMISELRGGNKTSEKQILDSIVSFVRSKGALPQEQMQQKQEPVAQDQNFGLN